MAEKRTKKRSVFRPFLILLLLAVALLAVFLAVVSQREGGLRTFWRELRGEKTATEFFFENASHGDAAGMDYSLAVAADAGLYVFDPTGEIAFTRLYAWQDQALATAGQYGAVYDVGGDTVIFFRENKILTELSSPYPIVSVSVNELGYVAVCSEADGYKGAVTVYNSLGTAIYRWSAGNSRVLSARVSGRDQLLVLTIGDGGSRLVLLRLDSEELQASYTFPGLMIDMAFTESGVTAVTTTSLVGLSGQLEERWTKEFEGRFLERYALSEQLTVIALTDYQVGGGRTVESLSAGGASRGVIALLDAPMDMDIRDGRVAVLTADRATVYDEALKETAAYECGFGAEHVSLRPDGSVICTGTFSAYVYGDKDKGEND